MALIESALVAIPPVGIDMSDARTKSSRRIDLESFHIGRTTVTRNDGSELPLHPVTWFTAVDWCNQASLEAGIRPAYSISGRDVVWDVGSDGYRLPTEAEWEAACRAGTTSPTYGPLDDIAWTSADGVESAQPVARKIPNSFGLFDTIGNVWEWCWDYADTARYGDYRSLRGGGWADEAWSCRASVRRGSAPDALLEDVGFRMERAAISGPLPIGWTPLR